MTKGERIKRLRMEKRITQPELAKMLHTTKQTISKYERGIVTNIPSDRIEELARILETTPEYILGWEVGSNEDMKKSDAIVDITDKLFRNSDFFELVSTISKFNNDELSRAKEIIALAFPENL